MIQVPQALNPIDLTAGCVTTNGGVTTDIISLKGATRAFAVFQLTQAAAHATTISLRQSTDNTTGTTAAGPTCNIWSNLDTATSDTKVKVTSGASYAVSTATKKMQVIFEIDPASLTEGYPYVYFTVADSSQATNFVAGQLFVEEGYQQATPATRLS